MLHCQRVAFIVALLLALVLIIAASGRESTGPRNNFTPVELDDGYILNRVERASDLWMNLTKTGILGNYGVDDDDAFFDIETDEWAPQAEYPGGSGVQYLYQAAFWIGALVEEGEDLIPRVSTATDGWLVNSGKEFIYDQSLHETGIFERSNIPGATNVWGGDIYDPEAVAHHEYIMTMYDDSPYIEDDPTDGAHRPLGIMVTIHSYAWGTTSYDQFIIVEYTVENVGEEILRNPYVGLFVDGDIGDLNIVEQRAVDDLSGYISSYQVNQEEVRIDVAYTADNDGRPVAVDSGNDFSSPAVAGIKILQLPSEDVRISYNWWVSNNILALDYGPAWSDDTSPGDWTATYGTPLGDARKYFLLSNRENDFDQVYANDLDYIANHPQEIRDDQGNVVETHQWRVPDFSNPDDLANGLDIRYLISFGPLGENVAPPEEPISTEFQPGEVINFTIAFIIGENFHQTDFPQPTNLEIDPSLFNLDDLVRYALTAQYIADQGFDVWIPYYPGNFNVVSQTDASVILGWDEFPQPVDGVNIYRRLFAEENWGDPINAELVTGTQYEDATVQAGQFYYYSACSLIGEEIVSRLAPKIYAYPGVPDPPTGLEATSAQNEVIPLTWNANTETDLDHYNIYRAPGDTFFVFLTTCTESSYLDEDVSNGVNYSYRITAVDEDGYESLPSSVVYATPMGFQEDLLVIREENTSPLNWSSALLEPFYTSLFEDVGETPDYLVTTNAGTLLEYSLQDLSNYRTVWLVSDCLSRMVWNYDYMRERNEILSSFLDLGGKLIISGQGIASKFYTQAVFGEWASVEDAGFLGTYFHADSLYAYPVPLQTAGEFIGALSVDEDYPTLNVDPDRANEMPIITMGQLKNTDVIYPNLGGEIIYTYVSDTPEISVVHGHPVGIRVSYENGLYPTVLFTFPLYAMEPRTELIMLVEQALADVRGFPPPPAVKYVRNELPEFFTLDAPYPNPFNSSATIQFAIPYSSRITLRVYNLLGQEILRLTEGRHDAGTYQTVVKADNWASGIYLINLKTDEVSLSRKIVLIR